MKALVINSPLFKNRNELYDEDSLPPIGLGLIATALENDGVQVNLIDAVALRMPLEDLIVLVNESKPDVICINVFTTNLSLVQEFISKLTFEVQVIVGGLSTSNLVDEIFNWDSQNQIDVVHGDGEKIIIDLYKNRVIQRPQRIGENRRYYVVDNDSPYFNTDISNENLNRKYFVNEPFYHPMGFYEANVVTSRGCIYNCSFCAAARSLNRNFNIREKSEQSVINEINSILSANPAINSIRVLDDLFLKNSQSITRAIEIFRDLKTNWRSMAHVQTFRGVTDKEIVELKNAGCRELFIGIESGSPKILKSIHKTHDVEVIKESIGLLLRNGIYVKGYFIYGFPEETIDDFELTFQLAKDLKLYADQHNTKFRTSVFQFRPYHGTELYHQIYQPDTHFTNEITQTIPNKELSDLVGRLQFNFHSGNYSNESIEILHDYIYKTTNLNPSSLFQDSGYFSN